ncbi:uncharacterized protein LOC141823158 [Curcuma longa]|uniref:uncharacterized protein LOC141823158 n=1 Tax=Curcuma longa TaxID=136217 RepID=UPI003D9ED434
MRSYVGQSKKGKKSSSAKQIRQPQRGLGVAQLEKIRLQNEMMDLRGQFPYPDSSSPSTSSSVFGVHPSFMIIGLEGSTEITYGEHFSGAAKWSLNDSNSHAMLFINKQDNETNNMRQDQQLQHYSTSSKGRDSDSALDLELKLSL